MKRLFKSILTVAAIAAISLSATARTSYRGFVELEPSLAISYTSIRTDIPQPSNGADFSFLGTTTHGVQFNRHIFAGAGIGANLVGYKDKHGIQQSDMNIMLPLFVAVRWDLDVAAKISPFVSGKIGYNIHLLDGEEYYFGLTEKDEYGATTSECYFHPANGLFYQVSAGVRFRLRNQIGFNLGLSIYPSQFSVKDSRYDGNKLDSFSRLNLGLILGLDF